MTKICLRRRDCEGGREGGGRRCNVILYRGTLERTHNLQEKLVLHKHEIHGNPDAYCTQTSSEVDERDVRDKGGTRVSCKLGMVAFAFHTCTFFSLRIPGRVELGTGVQKCTTFQGSPRKRSIWTRVCASSAALP